MLDAAMWPALDYSRVPYRLYHDPEAYQSEQERIFRGPTWNFLGLEAEIPNRGDFRTTYVGDTPVIVNRDANGTVHALVNRCAHRGAMIRREVSGNAGEHTCIYHQWCYDLDGRLKSIPFRRGIRGKGGSTRASRWRRTACASCGSPGSTARCLALLRKMSSRSKTISARRCWRSCAACLIGR